MHGNTVDFVLVDGDREHRVRLSPDMMFGQQVVRMEHYFNQRHVNTKMVRIRDLLDVPALTVCSFRPAGRP